MKIGIFVVAHDGLQSILTGVGVVVNSFIESFSILKKRSCLFRGHDVELNCMAPYIQKNSIDYHKDIRDKTEKICKKNNGRFIEIQTLSDGSSQKSVWGNVKQWEVASLNAANAIRLLKKGYDKIYIFGHDTIFCLIRYYLQEDNDNIFIWIPHSLGKIFYINKIDSKRINLEIKGINSILNSRLDKIGYIGEYFKKVLLKSYNVQKHKLIPLESGLYLNSERFILTKEEEKELKTKYNFPMNKRWIFYWGRCTRQKGLDFILRTFIRFPKLLGNKHLILLIPNETSSKGYMREIDKLLKKLPRSSFISIFSFDKKLPYFILKNKNLDTIIFASRFEGNPIAPLEARILNKRAKIVFSNIPSLNQIFTKNKRFLRFDLNYNSLKKALEQTSEQKVNKDNKKIKTKEIWENYVVGLKELD